MSGGHFDYKQWRITEIADRVESLVENNGREKTREELKGEFWHGDDWYEKYPEDLCHYKYPDEVIEKFKEGMKALRVAAVYAQRIDWLISGDDGEESFLKRLKEELDQLEK
jgi:hypothetical protein